MATPNMWGAPAAKIASVEYMCRMQCTWIGSDLNKTGKAQVFFDQVAYNKMMGIATEPGTLTWPESMAQTQDNSVSKDAADAVKGSAAFRDAASKRVLSV